MKGVSHPETHDCWELFPSLRLRSKRERGNTEAMKEPLPPGAGPSEEHSLCRTLREAAAEDQRQPALRSTALTPSSLLPCLPRGESTRNPRAREPRRGREWICGEGGTSAKTPTWRKEEVKRGMETVRKWQLEQ